jgi:hypothetical protein
MLSYLDKKKKKDPVEGFDKIMKSHMFHSLFGAFLFCSTQLFPLYFGWVSSCNLRAHHERLSSNS